MTHDTVLLDVLEEHLDELEFLWATRAILLYSPDSRPLHLDRLEQRMEAHLDGLREGGRAGIDLCERALSGAEASLRAAGAWGLLARAVPLSGQVAAAVDSADGAPSLGLRWALRHADAAAWRTAADRREPTRSAYAEAVWVDALVFQDRRLARERLGPLLQHEDPELRALAWGARMRAGPPPEPSELRLAVEDEDPAVRTSVLTAAARWGRIDLLVILRAAAERRGDRDAEAVRWLGALGMPEDLDRLERGLEHPSVANAALAGIGALGDPSGVPLLLAALEDDQKAEAAGAAFAALTGEPLGLRPAAGDDAAAEVPDAKEAREIWNKRAREFASGKRWRGARPLEALSLAEALATLDLEGARDFWLRECLVSGGRAPDVELERFACERGRELLR